MRSKRIDLPKSSIVKRSVVINGHKTSVSVEDIFWNTLKKIANDANVSVSETIANIDGARKSGNLSSAIRTYVLAHHVGSGDGYIDSRKPELDGARRDSASRLFGAGAPGMSNGRSSTMDGSAMDGES